MVFVSILGYLAAKPVFITQRFRVTQYLKTQKTGFVFTPPIQGQHPLLVITVQ